jgi:hypothetical protein
MAGTRSRAAREERLDVLPAILALVSFEDASDQQVIAERAIRAGVKGWTPADNPK